MHACMQARTHARTYIRMHVCMKNTHFQCRPPCRLGHRICRLQPHAER